MAIYTVPAEGDDPDGPGGRLADVGVVLEGVKVLHNLHSINHACVIMYGLIYALNLSYPKGLKDTFEVYQKILMDLESSKLSPKVRTLKLKLLRWLFFWGGAGMGGGYMPITSGTMLSLENQTFERAKEEYVFVIGIQIARLLS